MKLWGMGVGTDLLEDLQFLENLQHIHDNIEPPFWRHELVGCGSKYNLNTAQL
jgi:hypothetical protein